MYKRKRKEREFFKYAICPYISSEMAILAKIMDFDTGDHTMVCNSLGEVIIIFQTVQIVCQLVVAMQFPQ